MPKQNYGFEKKQRELRKGQKQEEKRQKKLARSEAAAGTDSEDFETATKPDSL